MLLSREKLSYLLVGSFNTLVGYFIGIAIYKALGGDLGIIWVGILSNIISITVSFLTYKIFVFRTKGKWVLEYVKSYLIYGGIAVIGIFFLWLFVEKMNISIWLSQALVIVVTVIISYVGHSRFTFSCKDI
jgi:putative flippase GtrA